MLILSLIFNLFTSTAHAQLNCAIPQKTAVNAAQELSAVAVEDKVMKKVRVEIQNFKSGQVTKLELYSGSPSGLKWTKDGKFLIITTSSYVARWDAEANSVEGISLISRNEILDVSPDGSKFAVFRKQMSTANLIFDTKSLRILHKVYAYDFLNQFGAMFTPDGNSLIFVGSVENNQQIRHTELSTYSLTDKKMTAPVTLPRGEHAHAIAPFATIQMMRDGNLSVFPDIYSKPFEWMTFDPIHNQILESRYVNEYGSDMVAFPNDDVMWIPIGTNDSRLYSMKTSQQVGRILKDFYPLSMDYDSGNGIMTVTSLGVILRADTKGKILKEVCAFAP